MARCREFDCDLALDRAMSVFWTKGYEATSIQDLVDATGVNRASLYGAYGGKRQLFEKVLERFRSTQAINFDQLAAGTPPGLPRIHEVFHRVACQTLTDSRGCLVLNSVAELASQDPALCALGQASRQLFETFFTECLRQARELGELPDDRNLPALARFLTNAVFGLRTMAKTRPDRQLIDDIVATTLAALQ